MMEEAERSGRPGSEGDGLPKAVAILVNALLKTHRITPLTVMILPVEVR